MAARAMACKMQPHSASLGVVAREMALDIADAIYDPQLATHVPGVANVAADTLSRRFMPVYAFIRPNILVRATEVHPPARTTDWWRSTVPRRANVKGES